MSHLSKCKIELGNKLQESPLSASMSSKNEQYRLLDEDTESSTGDGIDRKHSKHRKWTTTSLIISNVVSFCIAILLAALAPKVRRASLNEAIKRVSTYSPILDLVDIPLVDVQHDNTLYAHSKYAHYPSPEVDELWAELANPQIMLIDDEAVRRVGKNPEYTVQHPDRPGSHIAYLAANHQIHCLDSIRKNLFSEYYYPNGSSSPLHMDHMYHCIDMLLETLQCHASTEVITFNWWELATNPVPDFVVDMKCRDYDALREFERLPMDVSHFFSWKEEGWMSGWKRQGGEKNVSAPRQWWELQMDGGRITQEEMTARWGDT